MTTTAQDYATHLRTLLNLTPDTPRFHAGRDQHRRIDQAIRAAHDNLDQAPAGVDTSTDTLFAADHLTAHGFGATLKWTMFVFNEKAHAVVVDHVNQLSPWDLCAFLADLAAAGSMTMRQDREYFDAMAERLEAAGPTVWLITSGEDYGFNNTEGVFLDETAARKAFDTRALSFTVKEIQEETVGGVQTLKYRDRSDWIALEAHTVTS